MRDIPTPSPSSIPPAPIPLSYSTPAGRPGKPKRHEVYLMASVLAVLLAAAAVLFYVLVVAPPMTVTQSGSTTVYTTVAAPTEAMVMLFWLATLLPRPRLPPLRPRLLLPRPVDAQPASRPE